jgi:hypothetical protein
LRAVFLNTQWEVILSEMQRNIYDCIVGGITITPDRQRSLAWSVPYMTTTLSLVVVDAARSPAAMTLAGLKDATVGVQAATTEYDAAVAMQRAGQIGEVKVYPFAQIADAMKDLAAGRIGAVMKVYPVAAWLARLTRGYVEIISPLAELGRPGFQRYGRPELALDRKADRAGKHVVFCGLQFSRFLLVAFGEDDCGCAELRPIDLLLFVVDEVKQDLGALDRELGFIGSDRLELTAVWRRVRMGVAARLGLRPAGAIRAAGRDRAAETMAAWKNRILVPLRSARRVLILDPLLVRHLSPKRPPLRSA